MSVTPVIDARINEQDVTLLANMKHWAILHKQTQPWSWIASLSETEGVSTLCLLPETESQKREIALHKLVYYENVRKTNDFNLCQALISMNTNEVEKLCKEVPLREEHAALVIKLGVDIGFLGWFLDQARCPYDPQLICIAIENNDFEIFEFLFGRQQCNHFIRHKHLLVAIKSGSLEMVKMIFALVYPFGLCAGQVRANELVAAAIETGNISFLQFFIGAGCQFFREDLVFAQNECESVDTAQRKCHKADANTISFLRIQSDLKFELRIKLTML